MSVGNDEIDAQHQLWINLINQLASAVEQGDVSQAKLIHKEVMQYTHTHFTHEEMTMEAAEV